MHAERQSIALTTAADGSCTAYSTPVTGRILTVAYVKTDFADGVDFTITLENTGEAILTLTNQNTAGVFYPRVPIDDETGADALYAAGGTKLRDYVVAANDRVKVIVAAGGDTKTGTIKIVVG
ncbi:MAG TPA: hypothetical protein VEA69_21180 [Tepidisphaeraceae bacterium]|nr:hypothetical protein [Tepidisphaeraceae bacterium]